MKATDRQRLALLVAASAGAHLGVLSLLALVRPHLHDAAPPPVMNVEIVPLYVPRRTDEASPARNLAVQPIRPRRTLRPDERSDVAPLVTPNAPTTTSGPWALSPPAPGPAQPPADLRNALRRGTGGCATPELLNKDERAACQERLGRGARDAPFIPPPIAAEKQSEWDKAAARKRAKWKEREGSVSAPVPSGPSSPSQAPNPFPEVWTPRN